MSTLILSKLRRRDGASFYAMLRLLLFTSFIGIFAGPDAIPAGSFIGIYAGELLSYDVAEQRGMCVLSTSSVVNLDLNTL